MKRNINDHNRSSSWEEAGKWYDRIVRNEGHYDHQTTILPRLLPLLNLEPHSSLLDIGCGQGVLERHLPPSISYLGIDLSSHLITAAKKRTRANAHRNFLVADATQALDLKVCFFSHAVAMLCLQNFAYPLGAMQNCSRALQPNGSFHIVLNHPCFRIPRQSSWGIDMQKKVQYRRVDKYLSPLSIPIQTHPSQGTKSSETWSFHHPLSAYSAWLKETGFVIELIEEWSSSRLSTGKYASMENQSRLEFPLFLYLSARKRAN